MLLVGTDKTAVLVADRPLAKQQKLFFLNKSSKFQYVFWLWYAVHMCYLLAGRSV